MKESQNRTHRYCRNCHYPLPPLAQFCPNCSQKYTTGRVSILQLVKQLISNLFNLDSKLFRTLGALFVPARLSLHYFKGQHQRYASPFRVFLVTTLLCLTIFSILINQQDLSVKPFIKELELARRAEFTKELDSLLIGIEEESNHPKVSEAIDSLRYRISMDSLETSDLFFNTVKPSTLFSDSVESIIFTPPDISLTMEEIYEKHQLEHLVDRITARQTLKFFKAGDFSSFIQYLIGNTLWLMLLLLPTMALLLQLLYIRHTHYYVEHLIFLLHYHSFAFLFGALYLVIYLLISPINIAYMILPLFLYLYLAFYNYYQQGWLKTLIKYSVFALAYTILYVVFLSLISVISFFLF